MQLHKERVQACVLVKSTDRYESHPSIYNKGKLICSDALPMEVFVARDCTWMCIKFGKYRHKIAHYTACDECKKRITNLAFVNIYPVFQVLFCHNWDVM